MKLILIEGFSIIPPFYASYLRTQLLPQLGKVDVEVWGWNQKMPLQVTAGQYIIITHSFGFMALDKLPETFWTIGQPKALITIDPRSWTCDFGGASFKAPIPHTYNFYQRSWFSLPGYPVEGAANVLIKGYSHGSICGAPAITALVRSLL